MSGTMTAIVTLAALSAMLAGGVAAGQAATATQRAAGAADAAALAAADTLAGSGGAIGRAPCETAADLAEHNGARLADCTLDGMTATVTVSTTVLGMPVTAKARAGTLVGDSTTPDGRDHPNGELPPEALTPLPWRTDLRLRTDAAAALVALNAAFRAETGGDLPLSDAYRDFAGQVEQRELWCARGSCQFAAEPGTSNHGWGTAVDVAIGRTDWDSPVYLWLTANAARYGWTHPAWAEPDGSVPEAWHWEYG